MKKTILLFAMILAVGTVSAAKLYANFSSAGNSNVSWDASNKVIKVWGSSNNTYNMFTFDAGTLTLDTKIHVNIADKDHTRIIFIPSSGSNVEWSGFSSTGTKEVALSTINGLTSDNIGSIIAIRIGGKNVNDGYSESSPCSISIDPKETYLENDKFATYATFQSPASDGSYTSPTYSSSTGSNNLMTCFEFSNGELANYDKLVVSFTLVRGTVCIGYYVGNAWTQIQDYSTAGAKYLTVDLSTINSSNPAGVTKICFGGRGSGGEATIEERGLFLTRTRTIADANFQTPASSASYSFPQYTWTATNNNLMDIYQFSNGELANFETISFTIANLGSSVRMGTYTSESGSWQELTNDDGGNGFSNAGTKTVTLANQTRDLSTVTKISFGGKSGSGTNTVDFREDNVVLKTRQFSTHDGTRKYTVCLPYALDADEVTAVGGEFYELTSVSDGTLHFTKVTETTANKPYVYIPTKEYPFAEVALTKTPVAVSETNPIAYTVGGYTFTGVSAKQNVPSGAYGYNASTGAFSKTTTSDVTIKARRAYITGPADSGEGSVKSLTAVFNDDTTTGIQQMQSAPVSKAMYNLAGQRVGSGYKGIAIVNGKKVLMK